MRSKLDSLKEKILGNSNRLDFSTAFYYLAKELHCIPDILGREYEVVYEEVEFNFFNISTWFVRERVVGFRQKPMSVPSFLVLMEEMSNDYKNQSKAMKKGRRGKHG